MYSMNEINRNISHNIIISLENVFIFYMCTIKYSSIKELTVGRYWSLDIIGICAQMVY